MKDFARQFARYRLWQLLLVGLLSLLLLELWQQSLNQGYRLLDEQGRKLSRQLAQQTALAFSSTLALDDHEQAELQAQRLMSNPALQAISVFNRHGEQIAFEHRFEISAGLQGFERQQAIAKLLAKHLPVIEPVRHANQGDVGYVRLRMNPEHHVQNLSAAYLAQAELLPIALLLSLVIGFLLARMLSVKRWQARSDNGSFEDEPQEETKEEAKEKGQEKA
ncbi:AhpA/YtjB family protein [Paraferrimonas sedimenticola]|uniref:Virulence factor, hemolysin regulator n=1 Tax=Paraferrimonas sedimenticola TaxID=375674 RepID=A0AA37RX62_9GAMM|nr:hypothetical protein [Paraferrimonas sedimenticola]GLP96948.1 hypothetical protein GCM10007895_22540 [Paraferrimonas sedimenticola]